MTFTLECEEEQPCRERDQGKSIPENSKGKRPKVGAVLGCSRSILEEAGILECEGQGEDSGKAGKAEQVF